MSSSFNAFSAISIFPQIHDKEGTGEKAVRNKELQEEMVSPHQSRVYLPQNKR